MSLTMEEVPEVTIPVPTGQEEPAVSQGEATAPESTEVSAGEQSAEEPDAETETEQKKSPSRGVQKRLDEITREKYEWKREADYWREQATAKGDKQDTTPQPAASIPTTKPDPSQFDDYNEYVEALTDYKVMQSREKDREESKKHTEQAEQQRHQSELQQRQSKFRESATVKYPDFDDVMYSAQSVPCTENMMSAMIESDMGPDMVYFLAKNPNESARIAQLSPMTQIREIGKLEAKLSSIKPPEPKRITKTTEPIKTVSGAGVTHRDPNVMSMEDYAAWRMSQKG